MTAAGRVIWNRHGGGNWTFVRVNGLPGWPVTVNPGGTQMSVEDPHTSIANYAYTITILVNNGEVTSPTVWLEDDGPPMIMNE
jgi:hypothetical protein